MPEPRVRFKRDDGSSYPAWERQTVGDMTVELTDYKPLGCGLPLLTSARTGLMFQDEYRGKTSTENADTLFSVVPRGAVTYRHMSDDNIFHFNINGLVDAGLVSKEYPVFSTVNGNNISLLVEYLNSSKSFLEFCKAQKKGGTRTRLYFKALKNFEMMIPCPEEQQKIADFLSSVDEVITASEEEVANLETQKKAAMKKIFSQEVRFRRADGSVFPEWEEKRLDEVVEFLDGMRKPIETGDRVAGPYPYYGASGITDYVEGYIFDEDLILLSEDGANILDRNYRVCFMARGKYWVNNHAHVLRANTDCVNEYICEYLESLDYSRMNSGSAQPKINQQTCRKIPVKKPCLEEQRLIADFLSNFDEAIAAAKKELDLWKELKKGLLQQMFV